LDRPRSLLNEEFLKKAMSEGFVLTHGERRSGKGKLPTTSLS